MSMSMCASPMTIVINMTSTTAMIMRPGIPPASPTPMPMRIRACATAIGISPMPITPTATSCQGHQVQKP